MVSFNKKLGRILEESEALKPEDLQKAIQVCEEEGKALSSVVVK